MFLTAFIGEGYIHQTVNDKQTFIDPTTGAYTSSIEGYGTHTCKFMPPLKKDDEQYGAYLIEFMFRKRYCNNLAEQLIEAIKY